jgi:hypothetical protein
VGFFTSGQQAAKDTESLPQQQGAAYAALQQIIKPI